ncbi:phospholipase D-like domain-containing protein [Marivivens aquimaris]|uniref:phospholipase D-like domain-containing protein n=1 Tax=Marivivens aquimaris TaxID=2774876 RepID=UPI00188119E5|nr:phospholipase D-like domain-containing protein [Marivivens aquimaris]
MTLIPWLDTHIALMLTVLAAVGTAAAILRQRRSPRSAMAWLAFVVLIPYIAVPLFIALGIRRRGQRHRRAIKDQNGEPGLQRMLRAYDMPAPVDNNKIEFLPTPEVAKKAVFDVIASAEKDIVVSLYALTRDETGAAFVHALTDAVKRGVTVRLEVDAFGSLKRPRSAIRKFKKAGGHFRLFAPLIHGPMGQPMNLRNHRKLVLADGKRLWAGGRNVGRRYLGDSQNSDTWVDLSFYAEGPITHEFAQLFCETWTRCGGEIEDDWLENLGPYIENPGNSCLQLMPSGADQQGDALHDLIVHLVHRAERRIWICTPYFVPSSSLFEALSTARRRGVEVRVTFPERSNQSLADLARGPFVNELEELGVEMNVLRGKMLHAKVIILDDYTFVGSANVDERSLLVNYESMVIAWSQEDREYLVDWYQNLAERADTGLKPASKPWRLLEKIVSLAGPEL